jgi:hypothetical protein
VPPGAKACPGCGADEQTGWSEEAGGPDLGLPDENFDYDDYVKREFGKPSPVPEGIHWGWWIVAAALAAGMLLFWFR